MTVGWSDDRPCAVLGTLAVVRKSPCFCLGATAASGASPLGPTFNGGHEVASQKGANGEPNNL